ncbi:MAG: hypothetical protein EPO55_06355, partial [Reyranella sp.]|uniref:SIR2 family protein n=1 Tax=Reyranella sp. TaxID=1929291 RepID=UPI00121C812B
SDMPKAVVHLRAQYQRKRLGLIFGSGASKELGFPDWDQLVARIAEDGNVQGQKILEKFQPQGEAGSSKQVRSLASITQMLFSHYRDGCARKEGLSGSLTFLKEQRIRSDWLKIIHSCLYRDISGENREELINGHVYLKAFLEIIKTSPLTVNYNFDDTLEKMLLNARDHKEAVSTRGYEVTDKPNAQFQKDFGVIYHPNGYLPSAFDDGTSVEVVFSDDAFQDRLISAATGKYVHLSNHLLRNTCLLIGLSLDDSTLQSLLRQNAVTNPGNVHYIVQFLPEGDRPDDQTLEAVFESNFSSYNLYTLFLDSAGIKALAELVSMPTQPFDMKFPGASRKFVYYVVGCMGAGKSTAASNFRSLITYDEWFDERKAELAVPEDSLPPSEIADVNRWVAEQFRKKNYALNMAHEGIHLVDRCPLDPLAFGSPEERPTKAKSLIEKITDSGERRIERGHIIFLDGDLAELRLRNSLKHRYWPDDELERHLSALQDVYKDVSTSLICTRGRTISDVTREIAKTIFLERYNGTDVQEALAKVSAGQS